MYNCRPNTSVYEGKPEVQYNIGSFPDVHVYSNHTVPRLMSKTLYDTEIFSWACVNSGARVSVVGKAQADAYGKQTSKRLVWKPFSLRFKFCSHVCRILGRINVGMPTPDGS